VVVAVKERSDVVLLIKEEAWHDDSRCGLALFHSRAFLSLIGLPEQHMTTSKCMV
jgi:hypothetical protein